MDKEQLLELLRTGEIKLTNEMTIDNAITTMSEEDIKEAVIEFIYSR